MHPPQKPTYYIYIVAILTILLFYISLNPQIEPQSSLTSLKEIEKEKLLENDELGHKKHEDDEKWDDEDEDEEEDPITPPPTTKQTKKRVSLMDIASRILPLLPEDTTDDDYANDNRRKRKQSQRVKAEEEDTDEEQDSNDQTQEDGDEGGEEQEQQRTKKLSLSSTPSSEDADKAVKSTSQKATDWASHFNSPECKKFRSLPAGHAQTANLGQGQRSLCSRNQTERRTLEFRSELGGSIDISFIHKTIYIPVMKAGSQMFQEVFRRRLRGKRIFDRQLNYYLKKFDLKLEDFFVFTFVRDPLKTFVSAYGEVSKYAARNRTIVRGFAEIDDVPENEPARARQCLDNIKKGVFHGLVPAHMHTQLWKVSRCLSDLREKTELPINFIGHLENLDPDWQYVEQILNIPHQELPVIHASVPSKITPKRVLQFDAPSLNERFSPLTKEVCEYYKSDFACFGYDRSICDK